MRLHHNISRGVRVARRKRKKERKKERKKQTKKERTNERKKERTEGRKKGRKEGRKEEPTNQRTKEPKNQRKNGEGARTSIAAPHVSVAMPSVFWTLLSEAYFIRLTVPRSANTSVAHERNAPTCTPQNYRAHGGKESTECRGKRERERERETERAQERERERERERKRERESERERERARGATPPPPQHIAATAVARLASRGFARPRPQPLRPPPLLLPSRAFPTSAPGFRRRPRGTG